MSFLLRALVRWPASDRTKIITIMTLVILASAAPTVMKNTRDGHSFFSSEKPAAIRGDRELNLEVEKAKLAADSKKPL